MRRLRSWSRVTSACAVVAAGLTATPLSAQPPASSAAEAAAAADAPTGDAADETPMQRMLRLRTGGNMHIGSAGPAMRVGPLTLHADRRQVLDGIARRLPFSFPPDTAPHAVSSAAPSVAPRDAANAASTAAASDARSQSESLQRQSWQACQSGQIQRAARRLHDALLLGDRVSAATLRQWSGGGDAYDAGYAQLLESGSRHVESMGAWWFLLAYHASVRGDRDLAWMAMTRACADPDSPAIHAVVRLRVVGSTR